jgi:hypothetical protein
MKGVAAATVALFGLALFATDVPACTCFVDDSPHDKQVANAFAQSDFVAVIEIASTTVVTIAREETWNKLNRETQQYYPTTEIVEEQQLIAQINILRIWKGSRLITEVSTAVGGGSCGFYLRTGQQLLVYGFGPDEYGRIETGICTRTSSVEDAERDIVVLDTLATVEPPNNALERP